MQGGSSGASLPAGALRQCPSGTLRERTLSNYLKEAMSGDKKQSFYAFLVMGLTVRYALRQLKSCTFGYKPRECKKIRNKAT